MSKGKDEATFKINIAGNAAAASKEVAASARLAAKAIGEYEDEAKSISAELRRLRGNSDDVVATKAKLKSRLDEVRGSVSSLTVDLAKQGSSYKAAADAAKKYAEASKGAVAPNLRAGLGKLGGGAMKGLGTLGSGIGKKLAPLTKKLGDFAAPVTKAISAKLAPAGKTLSKWGGAAAKTFGKVGKAAAEDFGSVVGKIGPMLGTAVVGAATLAVAAVAAVAVGFVAAAVAVGAFGLAAADAHATMSRQRQALLGTAKDAGNLGDHIGQLAGKVPQGVAELNELSLALSKTRISGKATVSAMNAIAQVSGAVDASAGAKVQELITRGDAWGRMSIGMNELQGTGIDFDDVAAEYAAGTKKSIEAARAELRTGVAPIEAGSEALAKAAEKKLGKLNLANAFSLKNAPTKFMDQLSILSKGVDMGPMSKALQDAFGQLSPNAPLGAGIQKFMTTFGGGLVEIGAKAIPLLLEGFKYMVGFALELTAVFIETKTAIANALDGKSFLDIRAWNGIGVALMTGLAKGIWAGNSFVAEAVVGVGKGAIDAFTGLMKMQSPSKLFEEFGSYTTEGYANGVERGSQRASGAVQNMVDMPSEPAASAMGGGGSISVEINIHGMPTNDAQKMASPGVEAMLTRVVRDSLAGRGV